MEDAGRIVGYVAVYASRFLLRSPMEGSFWYIILRTSKRILLWDKGPGTCMLVNM